MNACMCTSVLILCVGVAIHIALPFIINDEINKTMKLSEDSALYNSWSSCRSGIIVEFYFFTVMNIRDFMNGHKPIVHQVGPYTYKQSTCKSRLEVFPQNGSVRYSDRNSFEFMREKSVGLESDTLTVLNLGYVAIANKIGENFPIDIVVDELVKYYYHSQLFLNKTVFEMIWGYEDPLLKFINKFFTIQTMIGLYANKNNSVGPTFEVDDGRNDTSMVGQILTFNGARRMSVWTTSSANCINGSDGSLFPPFLSSTSKIYVFSADICRSLQFHPNKDPEIVYINSVPCIKFLLSKETFLSPDEYPDNRGFCLNYTSCPKSGILDLRKCMRDAPIAISLPHFNGADPSYREDVIGMHPRDDMSISLYIEPQTGTILKALQLIQINAVVQNNPKFPELKHLKNVTYLPIGYINTSISVSNSVAHIIMSTLIVPRMSILVAASLMVASALVSLTVTSSMIIYHRSHLIFRTAIETEENTPLIIERPFDSACHERDQVSVPDSPPASSQNQIVQTTPPTGEEAKCI